MATCIIDARPTGSRSWTTTAVCSSAALRNLGVLRLLTSEAVMGQDVLTQRSAWQAYDRWHDDERVGFLDEPVDLEARFRSITRLRQPAPKDWADSYLAAFAEKSDLTMVTFDAALKAKTARAVLLTTSAKR
jgi:uncharacterized protein